MKEDVNTDKKDEYEYAGFWVRVGASLIDSILWLIVSIPLLFIVYGYNEYIDFFLYSEEFYIGGIERFLDFFILPIITILFWMKTSSTPGKKVFKLKVLDEKTGKNVDGGKGFIRYLMYGPSILLFGIGIIWIAFDKKKQGWHDKVAKTIVIKDRKS